MNLPTLVIVLFAHSWNNPSSDRLIGIWYFEVDVACIERCDVTGRTHAISRIEKLWTKNPIGTIVFLQ